MPDPAATAVVGREGLTRRMRSKFQRNAGGYAPPASSITAVLAAAALCVPAAAAPGPEAPHVYAGVSLVASGKVSRDLRPFYKARGYRALWVANGAPGPEADRLIALIESAELDGLDPRDYDPRDLAKAVARARAEGSPEALAKAEMALSRTFAAYVRDVRRPASVKMVYLDKELEPEAPDVATVLRVAALAPSLPTYVNEMGWASPIYARLRDALAEHRARWSALPEIQIPAGPVLRAGAKGERVRMLRMRLGFPQHGTFDKPLAAGLRAFQDAHGLKADAIAGAGTIAALNRGADYYERLLRLNLERARALPANPYGRHIVVDAASARLWLYENGVVTDTMRVIVGKPTEQTPMLAGMMRYAILNPYWNVPPDLVRRRIAPAMVEKGPSLLSAMGYEALSDWTLDARVIDPAAVDWAAVAEGRQDVRVRQLPGGRNAMGKMKFMFPNDLGIYLHDTPDKALFKDETRRFSSGCVRLEDAPRLAQWLFHQPLKSSSDAPEQHIELPQPVPVYITYLTAAPTEKGIAYREDAYERDKVQFAALTKR